MPKTVSLSKCNGNLLQLILTPLQLPQTENGNLIPSQQSKSEWKPQSICQVKTSSKIYEVWRLGNSRGHWKRILWDGV